MSTNVTSANDFLINYNGGEEIYKLGLNGFAYTEGVREIAVKTNSYWFLDIINSYQYKLLNEDFQVWKLEREYSYEIVLDEKKVLQRKLCFSVVCEDGNGNILVSQKIPFSDFSFDEYTIWVANKILYLPCEH